MREKGIRTPETPGFRALGTCNKFCWVSSDPQSLSVLTVKDSQSSPSSLPLLLRSPPPAPPCNPKNYPQQMPRKLYPSTLLSEGETYSDDSLHRGTKASSLDLRRRQLCQHCDLCSRAFHESAKFIWLLPISCLFSCLRCFNDSPPSTYHGS